jgi:nucleotide-binding universal stress UspA family protein
MFPPGRILVAVDFSDCSRVALNAAGRLAAQCDAELIVLHALDPLLAEAARAAGVDLAADTQLELTRFVHSAVASPDVRRLVVDGPAADTICVIARREQADVVVVGAHGNSPAVHAIFGSTTERVLQRSTISVFVVPFTWHAPEPCGHDFAGVGPVVVGVDFTSGSGAAAGAASQLAHLLRTRLEVIHVVTPIAALGRWQEHAERAALESTQHAQTELAHLVRGLRSDVTTTTRIERGDVARRLTEAAATDDGCRPMLVLGRHPASGHGASAGAVAYRVLMAAAAPVLVYLPMD